MRVYFSGLLFLAALNIAQAQEVPPADTPSDPPQIVQVIIDGQATSDLSEPLALNWTERANTNLYMGEISLALDQVMNVQLVRAKQSTNADAGLPDAAKAQFDALNQLPADRPRSIAICLERLQSLQDAYTRMDWLDEAAAIRARLEEYKTRRTKPQSAGWLLPLPGIQRGGTSFFTQPRLTGTQDTASATYRASLSNVTLSENPTYGEAKRAYRIAAPQPLPDTGPIGALPQAAKDLLAQLEQIKARGENKTHLQGGVDALRKMEITSAEAAQLDAALAIRDARLKFVGDVFGAVADPGGLTGYRGKAGQSFYFYVTGHAPGSVWGDGLYTDDSAPGAVAVHAGLLRVGQKGLLKITIRPGRDSYEGAERNGIISQPYAVWQGSYIAEVVRF